MNAFNFNHLYYFYITAKLEGITLAAKYLNTSQSSLSVQIKNLEHNLGKSLFKKVGRNIELTENGKEVFQFCRRAFETFEEMSDHIQKSKNSMGVRLNIGVASDIDRPFITEIIAKIIRSRPPSQRPLVRLISKEANTILDLLKSGELDFVLTTNVTLDGQVKLLQEFLLPVKAFSTNENKEFIKNKSLVEAMKQNLISVVLPTKPTILRAETEAFFVKKKIWPTITFESNIMASVIRASVDGIGVVLLPVAYVQREVKSDKLSLLQNETLWKHRLLFVSMRGSISEEKSKVAEQILVELEKLSTTN